MPANEQLKSIRGKVAIANAQARLTRATRRIFARPRWKALAAKGAQTPARALGQHQHQEPAYRDVLYVEELIGPDTVNTVPPATLDAFRDHGKSTPASLDRRVAGAMHKTMDDLGQARVSR